MRGLAVLLAASGVWVLVVGLSPKLRRPLPAIPLGRLATAIAVGVGATVLAFGLLGTAIPALAFGILASVIPFHVHGVRERKRQEDAAAAWPDLLAHVRSSVAAGRTLPDAYVDAAARVGDPFTETLDEVRRHLLYGGGFTEAMRVVRESASDPTADRVTMTLSVADEAGGARVGEVLAGLSASVAGETRVRRAHEAALTEQRWTAGVALCAPWVILALSIATNPQAAEAFGTAEGAAVVGIGLGLTAAGWVLSRRVASLSKTPRMFR